ncbi:MAG: FYDLN acid domain-containing protein [Myxococcaceae bacterium]|nr:FYDLN acid domain-containing protein [Myxococcaceae bacterium]
MPAKDLGTKYTCFKCSTKFYDLKKPDPLCPKCGADQRESPANKPASETRRGRLSAVPRIIEPVAPEPDESDLLGEEDEDFEDEDTDTEDDDL